jgi:AcrR family transcriptional regulator
MKQNEPSTQEAILLATIHCINENGIEHLTTRMIAEKAGANIASINYYFRTKEILINQVLETTIKHMLEDVNETILNLDLDFKEVLHDVIYYLITGAASNMGISQAHLYRLVIEKDYQSVSAASFMEVFDGLLSRAVQSFPDHEPAHLRRILASIFSAIMFMILTPFFFFQREEENQLNENTFQQEMIQHYTEMFYSMV